MIITSSEDAKQVPLEMVHLKTFVPKPKFVKPDEEELGEVMVPCPDIIVHKPEPTIGLLPESVALYTPQALIISDPALEMVVLAVATLIASVRGGPLPQTLQGTTESSPEVAISEKRTVMELLISPVVLIKPLPE